VYEQINVEHLLSAANIGNQLQEVAALGSYLESLSITAPEQVSPSQTPN
jgi:hypothetical protein